MESEQRVAPPVVALVVVHDPGVWFDEAVASLAAQDYPNLRLVFLVTGGTDETAMARVSDVIRRAAPDAYVSALTGNPGYGPAANQVQDLVEGDSGFFLLCHDDVALDRDAVTRLVEELYRSNAGIVGPKLVDWDRPATLQHVGLGLDRFGEVDPIIEPDEVDQEQHDAVSDVFAVPSACMLVRADLFRAIGGFDDGVDFHGDDVDLCWRAHWSGARVVVVPSARARHRERLEERRPDLNHRVLRARHRMRSVTTLTGLARLPLRSLELILVTLAELAVGLFTGRFQDAWASMRALVGLIVRTPALIARRWRVASLRAIPEPELIDLQVRGSSRLSSYLRTRETMTYVGADSAVRRWRPTSTAPTIAWLVVIAAVLIGSRRFIGDGVPAVGELLPFPDSPRRLFDEFTSGWNPDGFGATSPNPTGWALISLLSVGTAFQMGLAHTVAVLGLVFVGIAGAARLGTVFPSTRARVASFVVYAAAPLVPGLLAEGRWSGLVAYAAVPWFAHLLGRVAGIGTADARLDSIDLVDGVGPISNRERVRFVAGLGLLGAVAGAFAPVAVLVLGAVGAVLAVATVVGGGSLRTALWMLVGTVGGLVVAVALNLPWSTTWTWDTVTLAETAAPARRGLVEVASFGLGDHPLSAMALALYLPLLAALLLATAWRLTWSVRGALLVVGFGAVAVLADRGSIGGRLPDIGVLLVPVALGLSITAAASLAAFDLDVRGGGFGWRQPLGLLAGLAVAVAVVPGIVAATDGDWSAPERSPSTTLAGRLPVDTDVGDYRVLYLGDPRALPVPANELDGGVGYAVVDDGPLDVRDRWPSPDSELDSHLQDILRRLAAGEVARLGGELAPLGIRYVVVAGLATDDAAADDAVTGASGEGTDDGGAADELPGDAVDALDALDDESALPAPRGLVGALTRQLDLQLTFSPAATEVFENRAALPVVAQLEGATAMASAAGDPSGIDPAEAAAVFVGFDAAEPMPGTIAAGSVHVAVDDGRWELLDGDGEELPSRDSFGVVTAFDVAPDVAAQTGEASLHYETDGSRATWLLVVAAGWVVAMVAASRLRSPLRRGGRVTEDSTIIDLGSERDDVALDELLATESHGGWIDDVLEGSDDHGRDGI